MSIIQNESNIELLKGNFYLELDKFFQTNNNIVWNLSSFDKFFEAYLNSLLKTEFALFMKVQSGANFKNGFSIRTIKTIYGEIEVKVPRDRNGSFKSKILTKYSSSTEELSKVIIQLYQLGISHKDVCIFLEQIYGVKYSRPTIATMAQVTSELVVQFKTRKLDDYYIALFLDATYIPIKFANSYEQHGVHLIVGINRLGFQEIIGYTIGFRETTSLWADALDDLKSRGVKSVDIIVSDGFVGLSKVIKSRYPDAKIQRCIVHVLRNIKDKATNKDIPSILGDFSNLFKFTDRESYNHQLIYLINKYDKYREVLNNTFSDPNISTFLDYPKLMHRTIKTNNRIEAVNQKIKTRIKFKQNFPNVESFERTLVSSIIQQNNQSNKPVGGLIEYIRASKKR